MRGHTLRAHQPSEMGLKPRAFADQRFYRVQSEQLLVTQKSCALSELAVEGEGDEWCSGPCRPCGGDRVAPLGLRRRRQHHRRDTRLDLIEPLGEERVIFPLLDRKSTRLNSSHSCASRMPSSA